MAVLSSTDQKGIRGKEVVKMERCSVCGKFCRLEEAGLADPQTHKILSGSELELYDISDKLEVVCKDCL